jgi:hypothetical protein
VDDDQALLRNGPIDPLSLYRLAALHFLLVLLGSEI